MSEQKPDYLKPIYETIPKILTGYHQWVVWKAAFKDGKWTKVPYNPKTSKTAKTNDRDTWASYTAACDALANSNGRFDGIGFVLTESDPFVGLDFDHCVDCESEKETIADPFAGYVDLVSSYTEFSPSGNGIRVIAMATLPENHSCRQGSQVEVYTSGRYLTITGATLDGRGELRDANKEINQFYNTVFNDEQISCTETDTITPTESPRGLDPKAKKLFDGDTSGYASQSEADLALCSLIAKRIKDPQGIDELFRKSALYRDKWDKKHYSNVQTYGERIIEKVLSGERRGKPDRSLYADVKNFVDTIEGVFRNNEMYEDLVLKTSEDRRYARAVLSKLSQKGVVKRVTNRSGTWRKIDNELMEMNLLDTEVKNIDLTLPLGLHGLVNFHPGNIILVPGDVDAGKTAFMFNVVKDNVSQFNVHYYSSEMGPQEIKSRVVLFDDFPPLDHPNMHFYNRSADFEDVIRPGEKNLNIIDYLEVVENFFEIGRFIKDIHDTLDGAIAVIAVQKRDPFSDNPIGGVRALEKPRLAVSLKRGGTAKILKAKNWKTSLNPNKLIRKYKLAQGWYFSPQGSWMEETE